MICAPFFISLPSDVILIAEQAEAQSNKVAMGRLACFGDQQSCWQKEAEFQGTAQIC